MSQAIPPSLAKYMQTRDRRIHALYKFNATPITGMFERLMQGQVIRLGGRASCGGKVDSSWVEYTAWNEVIRKACSMGIQITTTPIKQGNAWATKCGGFWEENDYQLTGKGA